MLANFWDDPVAVEGDAEADADEDKLVGLDFKGNFGGNELIFSRVLMFGSVDALPL